MSSNRRGLVRTFFVGAVALATLVCTFSPPRIHASSAHDSGTILVWTDSTRLPGFQLYAKMHPNVKLKIVTYPGGGLPAKMILFNRVGSGWPDVVFDEDPKEVANLASSKIHYTADLTPLVPKSILDKFAPGSLSGFQLNGKLYALRNDIAQNVLWTNVKLMKKFGYKIPTTWEEYKALGLRVAKEHPGYYIGAVGFSFIVNSYYWASGCPMTEIVGVDKVHINMSDPACTRVTNMLDPLIANGSISKLGLFDAAFVKLGNQDKILMLPEASWYGQYVFKASYKTPNGEIADEPPLRWAADKVNWTGDEGGGPYFVSSHAKNLQAAADVAIWMSTNNAYQATAPTFPAYLPAADAWAATIAKDPFYATNPYPVLKAAASLINPKFGLVRYDAENTFEQLALPALKAGKTLASIMPTYQTQLEQLARTEGYTVVH
jgi:multiple sugar transport system substrate-binding protein